MLMLESCSMGLAWDDVVVGVEGLWYGAGRC